MISAITKNLRASHFLNSQRKGDDDDVSLAEN